MSLHALPPRLQVGVELAHSAVRWLVDEGDYRGARRMLGVTFFGLVFTPVFYGIIMRFACKPKAGDVPPVNKRGESPV